LITLYIFFLTLKSGLGNIYFIIFVKQCDWWN